MSGRFLNYFSATTHFFICQIFFKTPVTANFNSHVDSTVVPIHRCNPPSLDGPGRTKKAHSIIDEAGF
jgi:hypothetical protein